MKEKRFEKKTFEPLHYHFLLENPSPIAGIKHHDNKNVHEL
jgi:hypothetical protein